MPWIVRLQLQEEHLQEEPPRTIPHNVICAKPTWQARFGKTVWPCHSAVIKTTTVNLSKCLTFIEMCLDSQSDHNVSYEIPVQASAMYQQHLWTQQALTGMQSLALRHYGDHCKTRSCNLQGSRLNILPTVLPCPHLLNPANDFQQNTGLDVYHVYFIFNNNSQV